MLAAILTQPNQPLELHDISWRALRYGQVYVRVLVTGICGAQMQEWRGEKGTHFPRLLGHEACVEVIDVGAGVKLSPGDRAVAHWRKGDGLESESPVFTLRGSRHTAGQITTFSTHSVISENRLTKVPKETPVELCALLGCGLSTALGTMENEANLRLGESVLIIGCGGLGLNLILAAKLRKASRIVVLDIFDKRSEATRMGVGDFYQFPQDAAAFACSQLNFDAVIDTTGDPDAIATGIECLGASGRFIMVGQPKPGVSVELANARHMFDGSGKTILATQGGRFSPSLDIPRYVALHQAGLLNLDGLVSHRLKLENINDGLELVRQGQAGRILIDCAE